MIHILAYYVYVFAPSYSRFWFCACMFVTYIRTTLICVLCTYSFVSIQCEQKLCGKSDKFFGIVTFLCKPGKFVHRVHSICFVRRIKISGPWNSIKIGSLPRLVVFLSPAPCRLIINKCGWQWWSLKRLKQPQNKPFCHISTFSSYFLRMFISKVSSFNPS